MKTRAFVTGGSRGIGAAIALRLAQAGHPIILNFRSNQAAAEEVRARIEALGVEVTLCPFDVADADMLMPPKSTWFEPKLRSGLFIHRI